MAELGTLTQSGAQAESSVDAMEAALQQFKRTTFDSLLEQAEDLNRQKDEALALDDKAESAARMQIINSSMEKLAQEMPKYRDDTAELIAGLESTLTKMGIDLKNLEKPRPEDLRIIEDAEKALEALKPALDHKIAGVDAEIAEIQGGWFVTNKAGKIAELEAKKEGFKAQFALDTQSAGVAVEEAKADVERTRRARIRNAEFDAQFDRFIAIASQIQQALMENVKNSEVRMASTRKELDAAMKQKEELSGQIAELEDTIASKQDAVMALELQVGSTVEQADRDALARQLSAANQELSDLNGRRQEMEVVRNSLESAATKHETMLDAIIVQRDNQRAHAMKLATDSRARFEQAKNIVAIIQNTSQEDAASKLHGVGSGLDHMSVEIAARALIASEKERIRMLEQHHEDKRIFADQNEALAEGRAQVAIKDAEIRELARQNTGIDIADQSWLQLAERYATAGAEAA